MKKEIRKNPRKFIGIGIAFLCAGIALTASMENMVGTGLIGVGAVFFILGMRARNHNNRQDFEDKLNNS